MFVARVGFCWFAGDVIRGGRCRSRWESELGAVGDFLIFCGRTREKAEEGAPGADGFVEDSEKKNWRGEGDNDNNKCLVTIKTATRELGQSKG